MLRRFQIDKIYSPLIFIVLICLIGYSLCRASDIPECYGNCEECEEKNDCDYTYL